MPDGIHYNRQSETLLRLPIGDLAAWHLVAECGACRTERYVMVRDLVARFGAQSTLVMLMPRLRCNVAKCRRPPTRVRLRSKFPAALDDPAMVEIVVESDRNTGVVDARD